MATWDVKITPLNVARKEASITATRTDGEDVRTFSIITALLSDTAQKACIAEGIWKQFLDDQAKRSEADTYIGNLAEEAKANLEAREK